MYFVCSLWRRNQQKALCALHQKSVCRLFKFLAVSVTHCPLADHGEELPPVISVQQQQAEQMRVYWKVS